MVLLCGCTKVHNTSQVAYCTLFLLIIKYKAPKPWTGKGKQSKLYYKSNIYRFIDQYNLALVYIYTHTHIYTRMGRKKKRGRQQASLFFIGTGKPLNFLRIGKSGACFDGCGGQDPS